MDGRLDDGARCLRADSRQSKSRCYADRTAAAGAADREIRMEIVFNPPTSSTETVRHSVGYKVSPFRHIRFSNEHGACFSKPSDERSVPAGEAVSKCKGACGGVHIFACGYVIF